LPRKIYEGPSYPPHPITGTIYTSFKFPLLEYIFFHLIQGHKPPQLGTNLVFTLQQYSQACDACRYSRPTSSSNVILDLTRKAGPPTKRLPQSIVDYGYDLKKKTGRIGREISYAGEFVHVGVGKSLKSWLVWPDIPHRNIVIPNTVPYQILTYLRKDEGALFSVIDYCDVFSLALHGIPGTILRVQNPMKWQPNEIDGLYYSEYGGTQTLYPVEAKALSTRDDINLVQMWGAYQTIQTKLPGVHVVPIAAQMFRNGIRIGIMKPTKTTLKLQHYIDVQFAPIIPSWH